MAKTCHIELILLTEHQASNVSIQMYWCNILVSYHNNKNFYFRFESVPKMRLKYRETFN